MSGQHCYLTARASRTRLFWVFRVNDVCCCFCPISAGDKLQQTFTLQNCQGTKIVNTVAEILGLMCMMGRQEIIDIVLNAVFSMNTLNVPLAG